MIVRRAVTLSVLGALLGLVLAALVASAALLVGVAATRALGGDTEGEQLRLAPSGASWSHLFWRLLLPLELFGLVAVSSMASSRRRRRDERRRVLQGREGPEARWTA